VAAALPISGLTAWQGLFDHAHLKTGQAVLIHGAAGAVGSIAVQLARELGARVIGTGRAGDRETALGLGADAFVDLQADRLEDAGEVGVALDVIGGKVLERSAPLVRADGTLVMIVGPPTVWPADGRASAAIRGGTSPMIARLPMAWNDRAYRRARSEAELIAGPRSNRTWSSLTSA
jgi:NADPH:quinone reductase-like Zn-dependent oxidoreductase